MCTAAEIVKDFNYLHFQDTYVLLPPASEVWGKVIFSEACVKNSVHKGEVCLSACWNTTPPRSRQPLFLEQTPPWSRHPRGQAPPCAVHAGRCGQQAGGMHPIGMQSCFYTMYSFNNVCSAYLPSANFAESLNSHYSRSI